MYKYSIIHCLARDLFVIELMNWCYWYWTVRIMRVFEQNYMEDEIPFEFLHYKNFIILHRETRDMSTAYLSQILRIFYPCILNNVRGTIMTTDIDMFPIKRSFFENAKLENEQDCFVYLSSNNKDWANICYCIANKKIWKELMNISS